ncbi:MAG TPA: ABC transporter ATP-binding protein [Armatimonadetes bacterium]|nr:ABC transporter ATP-binding protein [Armatimonadota bacterium]
MAEIVLQTYNLTKDYRRRRVVEGVNLTVRRGDVFGFLGPNGAGKSTTIRLLLGLVRPTAGEAELLGISVQRHPVEARKRVGALVETPAFYPFLTGRENLRVFSALSGGASEERVEEVLALVGLSGRGDDRVRTYSHGMKQRLALAQALLPDPELIILDEPTSGLDPQGMKEVRDLIRQLAQRQGVTVFLSSHLLFEVEQICNRVAIIHQGRLRAQGEVADLLPRGQYRVQVTVSEPQRAAALLREQPFVQEVEVTAGGVEVALRGDYAAEVNACLVQRGLQVSALVPHYCSLEEYFLELVQGGN